MIEDAAGYLTLYHCSHRKVYSQAQRTTLSKEKRTDDELKSLVKRQVMPEGIVQEDVDVV